MCVCSRVWIEIGILNIHFGHIFLFSFLFSRLSFPFHSDVGCWMVYSGSEVFVVSKYVMDVWDVVFNVFKLSVLPHSCPELKNVEWVCVREWIEIGILDIHFAQFSTSLFSSLTSHFLSTPMFDVGWCILEVRCLCYPTTSPLLIDVVFNVFKLSVLPHSCPELTNVE